MSGCVGVPSSSYPFMIVASPQDHAPHFLSTTMPVIHPCPVPGITDARRGSTDIFIMPGGSKEQTPQQLAQSLAIAVADSRR